MLRFALFRSRAACAFRGRFELFIRARFGPCPPGFHCGVPRIKLLLLSIAFALALLLLYASVFRTSDCTHYRRCVFASFSLPSTRARLGCALAFGPTTYYCVSLLLCWSIVACSGSSCSVLLSLPPLRGRVLSCLRLYVRALSVRGLLALTHTTCTLWCTSTTPLITSSLFASALLRLVVVF